MSESFGYHWTIARHTLQQALGGRIDPDLAKDAARLRALELRQRLTPETHLLSERPPLALANLFRVIARD